MWLTKKKLRKLLNGEYDKGIYRGYEMGYHMGEAGGQSFTAYSDEWGSIKDYTTFKPYIIRFAEKLLREKQGGK